MDRASVGDPGHLTPPRVTDSSEQAPSAPPAEEQRRCTTGARAGRLKFSLQRFLLVADRMIVGNDSADQQDREVLAVVCRTRPWQCPLHAVDCSAQAIC